STTHHTSRCKLTERNREQVARSKRLCLACLEPGHMLVKCSNQHLECKKCSGHHWSFMCSIIKRYTSQRRTSISSGQVANVNITASMNDVGTATQRSAGAAPVQNSPVVNNSTPSTSIAVCHLGASQHQTCLVKVN